MIFLVFERYDLLILVTFDRDSLGGGFKYVLFSSLFGKMIQFD